MRSAHVARCAVGRRCERHPQCEHVVHRNKPRPRSDSDVHPATWYTVWRPWGALTRGPLAANLPRPSASSGLVGYRDMKSGGVARRSCRAALCMPRMPKRNATPGREL
jgi:hypothetical protein